LLNYRNNSKDTSTNILRLVTGISKFPNHIENDQSQGDSGGLITEKSGATFQQCICSSRKSYGISPQSAGKLNSWLDEPFGVRILDFLALEC
jgi:hypothetical protein